MREIARTGVLGIQIKFQLKCDWRKKLEILSILLKASLNLYFFCLFLDAYGNVDG